METLCTYKDKVFGGRRRTEEKTTSVLEVYVWFFPVAGWGPSGEHVHIFHNCPVLDFYEECVIQFSSIESKVV